MLRANGVIGPLCDPHGKRAARLSASTKLGDETRRHADSSRELNALPVRVIFEEGCQW